MSFKVGDRVCCNAYNGITSPRIGYPVGMCGTVIVLKSNGQIGVDFDHFEHGHNLNGLIGNNVRRGWYLSHSELSPLFKKQEDVVRMGITKFWSKISA